MILRLLVSWGRISTFNSVLEGYPSIWTSANLLILLKDLLVKKENEFTEKLMESPMINNMLLNSSMVMRK